MPVRPSALGFLFVAVLAGPSPAAPDPAERIRALAGSGSTKKALVLAGRLLAKAQRKNDLLAEQRAWELVRGVFAKEDPRDVWAGLLPHLEPKRGGAFVAAHLLAERLVFACIERGDRAHLEEAAAALAARARVRGAGRHVGLVARLARAVADGGAGAAAVCVDAKEAGWPELAGMAAIATFQGAEAADRDAQRAEDAVVAAMIAAGDSGLAMAWAQPIKERLRTNPHAVAAVTRVMKRIGSISVQPLVGPGAGAERGRTPLGRAWRRHRRNKPLATLARRDGGLRLAHGFEPFETILAVRPGLKFHAHGGLRLGLSRAGVAVRHLDPDGTAKRPDDAEVPGPFDLVHRLAPGETWTLRKTGVEIR